MNRNVYIEINRIIFTFFIILMHGEYLIRDIASERVFRGGYIGVEFFFIVSGYFLARSIEKGEIKTKSYLQSRLKRLYPHYILSITLMAVIVGYQYLDWQLLSQTYFEHVIMIQNMVSCNLYLNGPLWYVTYLIIIGTMIFAVERNLGGKQYRKYMMCIVIIYYLYSFLFCGCADISNKILFLPEGFYRGVADISIGMFCYDVSLYLPDRVTKKHLLWIVPLMLLEILLNTVCPKSRWDYLCVVIFAISITLTSKMQFGEMKAVKFLSEHTYSIYCYQVFTFYVLERVYEKFHVWIFTAQWIRAVVVMGTCFGMGVMFDYIILFIRKVYRMVRGNDKSFLV